MTVALISTNPYAVISVFPVVPDPVLIPNNIQVYGAAVGWTGDGYALVAVTPFVPASGYQVTGAPSYSVNGLGVVTETYSTVLIPAQTALQHAAGLIAAGLPIVSTGTSSLNATYAIDPATQLEIASISLYAVEYSVFPDGAASLAWPDAGGTLHTFSTTTSFQAFARAIADYVAAVEEVANVLTAGGSASWPTASATIP